MNTDKGELAMDEKTTQARRQGNGAVPESLNAALAALQARLPKVGKGETAQVRSDKGNYSYKYADLADVSQAVLPLLGSLGLAFTAKPTLINGQFVLAYSLRHVSGESDDGIYPLPSQGSPQSVGSAITYARRYCLCAVTGVAPDSDDDDGAAAQTSHVMSSRNAGDAWERATPAPPRGQRASEQPQSAGDAWDQAAPAGDNGHHAPHSQPASVAADDELLGAWAGKLDEITSIEDGIAASSELERDHKGGVIDGRRYKVIRGAIESKVAGLGNGQRQERPHRPQGPSAGERGAKPVPTGKGDDGEWVRHFTERVGLADTADDLSSLQQQVGNAVRAKTISPAKSAELSGLIRDRRRALEEVPA